MFFVVHNTTAQVVIIDDEGHVAHPKEFAVVTATPQVQRALDDGHLTNVTSRIGKSSSLAALAAKKLADRRNKEAATAVPADTINTKPAS